MATQSEVKAALDDISRTIRDERQALVNSKKRISDAEERKAKAELRSPKAIYDIVEMIKSEGFNKERKK